MEALCCSVGGVTNGKQSGRSRLLRCIVHSFMPDVQWLAMAANVSLRGGGVNFKLL